MISQDITQSPFTGDIRNATIEDVARFYASQGITTALADDAAIFAIEWLSTASIHDSVAMAEILAVRSRVLSTVRSGTIPMGINNDY